MSTNNPYYYQSALEDFNQARRQAAMQQLLSRFTGEQTELLSYDDVKQKLKVANVRERGLQEIPVDKIIGSVGRYKDFTRSFLPKSDIGGERWARVKAAVSDLAGLAPIEVYQLGDAYFVIDGNHRVSIARQQDTIINQNFFLPVRGFRITDGLRKIGGQSFFSGRRREFERKYLRRRIDLQRRQLFSGPVRDAGWNLHKVVRLHRQFFNF